MRCIACVSGERWPENKSRKRRGCCAELRAGTGVRDLGCEAMLCSVPGWLLLSLLLLGLREGRLSLMRGPAAGTGGQGALGARGLVTTRPSLLGDGGSAGLECCKGFGVLRGSPLLRSPCICQVAGAAGGGSAALGLSACDLKRRWLAGRRCPQACPLGRRTAQRCANLQLRSLHSVLLKRMQSVLFPCLSCRLRMASVSAATLPSSFRRVCTLPPPFLVLCFPKAHASQSEVESPWTGKMFHQIFQSSTECIPLITDKESAIRKKFQPRPYDKKNYHQKM